MHTLATLPSTANAMAALLASHAAIAEPLQARPAVEDADATASIATDDGTIVVNPVFMAAQDEGGRIYMLAFIGMILAGGFLGRVGDRDPLAWSTACNIWVHHNLRDLGLTGRPAATDGLDDASFKNLFPEEIYDRLEDGSHMVFSRQAKATADDHLPKSEPIFRD